MEQSGKKRIRGANYTHEEKNLLADLVSEYKDIIDDKRTNGLFLKRKKEAWLKIADVYNNCATSGCRSVDQLRVLYDNWKQSTRKRVAKRNNTMCTGAAMSDNSSHSFEHVEVDNKIQIHELTGESYEPKHADDGYDVNVEDDVSISSIKEEPLTPPNPFDSGTAHIGDLNNHREKKKTNPSVEFYKRVYFKRKCQVANLEKKKLMQQILQQKQQHNLTMQILRLKLSTISSNNTEL